MNKEPKYLDIICAEGEGYQVEFKEKVSGLDREIVAFSNASGGKIFLGIKDDGTIKGIDATNSLKSQLQDIAHNCDPSIRINIISHLKSKVLEIHVEEGFDKPYRCREGFFIRNGASSQKLKRDEILTVLLQKVRFDEAVHPTFRYPDNFSTQRLKNYLISCRIQTDTNEQDLLLSLNAAREVKSEIKLTNAGVLFFAENTQTFFPESYLTCVRYKGNDRFSIFDKKDFQGSLIEQIEATMDFLTRHIITGISLDSPNLAQNNRTEEYPLIALREAIINAVTHRDYVYDGSHIYVHLFNDRIEIENPGGLCHGMSIDKLGQRSVRRNRLIADLLHRAGYIERVGSGFSRMTHALSENQNPPLDVDATNFFLVRFKPRVMIEGLIDLSDRQQSLFQLFEQKPNLTQKEIANQLNISRDTVIRELKILIDKGLIERAGVGKATYYKLK